MIMRFSYIVSVCLQTQTMLHWHGVSFFKKQFILIALFQDQDLDHWTFLGGVLDMTYMYIRNSLLLYTPSVPPSWDCKYDF